MAPNGMRVRLLVGLLLALATAAPAWAKVEVRAATADEQAALQNAIESTAAEMVRWAYTEARLVRDLKGKPKTDVVVRFDPSKPYPEQWTPLEVAGGPPSERDVEKYRKQGERTQRRVERGEPARRYSLGELLDLTAPRIRGEDASSWLFEIPLRADRGNRFPPEKFEVLARVERADGALTRIEVRLRETFRRKLVFAAKSGGAVLEFARIDPQRPPILSRIRGEGAGSVLFVPVGGDLAIERRDFKRVRPWDERFDVQIGTLRAIDF